MRLCCAFPSSSIAGAAGLNTLKAQYKAGLDVITALLSSRYGIAFNDAAHPYFSAGGKSSIYWQRLAKAQGDASSKAAQNLIGAAFNLKMLTSDFGGYAHNQQYTMSLIFDTIDYLQDGSVTGVLDVTDPVLGPQIQFIFGAAPVRPI